MTTTKTRTKSPKVMGKITKLQLWEFLARKANLSAEALDILRHCQIRKIIAKQAPLDPSWAEACGFIDLVLKAQKEGYKIVTWCGHNQEILVAGYRPEQVIIQEGTPTLSCRCGHNGAILGERVARCMVEEDYMPNCTKCRSKMRVTYRK